MTQNDANIPPEEVRLIREWTPLRWHQLAIDFRDRRDYQEVINNIRSGSRHKPQSILLVGARGAGTLTLANFIARSACCRCYSSGGACGRCRWCRTAPYAPDMKELAEAATARMRKLTERSARRKPGREEPEGVVMMSRQDESRDPGVPVSSPLLIYVRGSDLTKEGLSELFKRTSRVRLFRLVLIDGLDEVPETLQGEMHEEFMEVYKKSSWARVCWVCTATDEAGVHPLVLASLTMSVGVTPPSPDCLLAFLGDRCREWGIAYTPDRLRALSQRLQRSAHTPGHGMSEELKEVLAGAVIGGRVLTDELVRSVGRAEGD